MMMKKFKATTRFRSAAFLIISYVRLTFITICLHINLIKPNTDMLVATSGTGTTYPSGKHEITPVFRGLMMSNF
jgi:hypothetical protein